VTYRENVEGDGHPARRGQSSQSLEGYQPLRRHLRTCSSAAISGRKVAKKHPVLEWFVSTSDERYLRAREGPIDLMSLSDPAESYNLIRGPQSAPTAGVEV